MKRAGANALALCILIFSAGVAVAEIPYQTNVTDHGARGDGSTDDSAAFKRAIDNLTPGGRLVIPPGKYVLGNTVIITKPITIAGTGFGSQIYGSGNASLFQFVNVNNAAIRDLYLGSASNAAGISLIELLNSHHNQIDNVTMLGGNVGLHLYGSVLNTIIDLRSGTNFGGFFATTAINQTWVLAEPYNGISANANTFTAPALEGGVNGVVLSDNQGQGSLHMTGGTIEGGSGIGLSLNGTFLPTSITGVHFEANGVADIVVSASSNIRMTAIASLPNATSAGLTLISVVGDSRNVQISDSLITSISVANTTKRIQLQNITFGVAANYTAYNNINLPAVMSSSNPVGPLVNITAFNVGNYAGGQ